MNWLNGCYENLYSPYNGSIIYNRKIDVKNLSKQSDYDDRYQLLNGKVTQKTLTSHNFFNKFNFSSEVHFKVKIIPGIIIIIIIKNGKINVTLCRNAAETLYIVVMNKVLYIKPDG